MNNNSKNDVNKKNNIISNNTDKNTNNSKKKYHRINDNSHKNPKNAVKENEKNLKMKNFLKKSVHGKKRPLHENFNTNLHFVSDLWKKFFFE